MDKMNEKKEDAKNNKRTLWMWIFAVIVIFFIGYSTFWDFKLSFELLTALALLLFFFIYDDVKEISIGSILSIKKEVEKVAQEQEKLSTIINSLFLSQQTQQSQNIQVTIPSPEISLEKREDSVNKELMNLIIEQHKELKQWEEYSTKQNQTVEQLQNELKKARGDIIRLLIEKEIAEFNYLDYFFTYNTKRLLFWLVNKGSSANYLEVVIKATHIGIIQDNLKTTIDMLQRNNMISIADNIYSAAQRGKIFLDYIGFKEPVLPTMGPFAKLYSNLVKK